MTEIGLEELQKATLILKAMAHPCRLRLLMLLSAEEICDVATLARLCKQQQPYISQQLRVLRLYGLVAGDRHGQRVCYRLANPKVKAILQIAILTNPLPTRLRTATIVGNGAGGGG